VTTSLQLLKKNPTVGATEVLPAPL